MSVISKTARKFLKSILPDSVRHRLLVLENVHSYGGLFEAESMFYRWVGKAVTRKTHSRVHTGPFRGMRYIHHAVHVQSSAYCPKLLGTYEQELHSVVDSLRTQRPYQRVINIGAGEGYYAVGLALHLPQSRLTAFEADPDSRKVLSQIAHANGVASRLTIREFCIPPLLQEELGTGGRALVVCDVEGGEQELLDPKVIPALADTDILVELHDFIIPGISDTIRERFARTHRILDIPAQPRQLRDWPPSLSLPQAYRRTALSEYRPGGMRWFWMTAHSRAIPAK